MRDPGRGLALRLLARFWPEEIVMKVRMQAVSSASVPHSQR